MVRSLIGTPSGPHSLDIHAWSGDVLQGPYVISLLQQNHHRTLLTRG